MSVLIKGMTMPKNCNTCLLSCSRSLVYIGKGEERNANCPLVEVPPHGRLVDADALKATFCAECNHTITCGDCDIDYHIGRMAPTIIEAEEVDA